MIATNNTLLFDRQASTRFLMPQIELPVELTDKLAPRRSALVLIDMQNDFCAEGGYIDLVTGNDVSAGAALVPRLQALIDAARSVDVPVIWVRADYSMDKIPPSMRVVSQARGITAECCKPGTWGAAWFGIAPLPEDKIVTKHTYSGFANTELNDILRALKVQSVVFGGVTTQVCVESTVRDAHSAGYLCIVPHDAVASHTPSLHDAALTNIRFFLGDVCAAADVLAVWH